MVYLRYLAWEVKETGSNTGILYHKNTKNPSWEKQSLLFLRAIVTGIQRDECFTNSVKRYFYVLKKCLLISSVKILRITSQEAWWLLDGGKFPMEKLLRYFR